MLLFLVPGVLADHIGQCPNGFCYDNTHCGVEGEGAPTRGVECAPFYRCLNHEGEFGPEYGECVVGLTSFCPSDNSGTCDCADSAACQSWMDGGGEGGYCTSQDEIPCAEGYNCQRINGGTFGCVIKCGDGDIDEGENCNNCPADVGMCCGNGRCDIEFAEFCSTCEADCGVCSTPSDADLYIRAGDSQENCNPGDKSVGKIQDGPESDDHYVVCSKNEFLTEFDVFFGVMEIGSNPTPTYLKSEGKKFCYNYGMDYITAGKLYDDGAQYYDYYAVMCGGKEETCEDGQFIIKSRHTCTSPYQRYVVYPNDPQGALTEDFLCVAPNYDLTCLEDSKGVAEGPVVTDPFAKVKNCVNKNGNAEQFCSSGALQEQGYIESSSCVSNLQFRYSEYHQYLNNEYFCILPEYPEHLMYDENYIISYSETSPCSTGHTTIFAGVIYLMRQFEGSVSLDSDDDGILSFNSLDINEIDIQFSRKISDDYSGHPGPYTCDEFILPRGWYFVEASLNNDGGPGFFNDGGPGFLRFSMDFGENKDRYLGYVGEIYPDMLSEDSEITCDMLPYGDDCDMEEYADVCEGEFSEPGVNDPIGSYLHIDEQTPGVSNYDDNRCCGDDPLDQNHVNGDKTCIGTTWTEGFEIECNDGSDNDGDGPIDMEDDSSCQANCELISDKGLNWFVDADTTWTGFSPSTNTGLDGCCGDDTEFGFDQGGYTPNPPEDPEYPETVQICSNRMAGNVCSGLGQSECNGAPLCSWSYFMSGTCVPRFDCSEQPISQCESQLGDICQLFEVPFGEPGTCEKTETSPCDGQSAPNCNFVCFWDPIGASPIFVKVPLLPECTNRAFCRNQMTEAGCEDLFPDHCEWIPDPVCGNSELEEGEECESASDCESGEECMYCTCYDPGSGEKTYYGDLGSFSPDNAAYCANDMVYTDKETISIPDYPNSQYHWWGASEIDFVYLRHYIQDVTEIASNYEVFSYCNANEEIQLTGGVALADREHLPAADIVVYPSIGEYQYWPDLNCDGIPDIWETIQGQPCGHYEGDEWVPGDLIEEPICRQCPYPNDDYLDYFSDEWDDALGQDCWGPMSICDFLDGIHSSTMNGYNEDECGNYLTECTPEQHNPCTGGSSGDEEKDEWFYPEGFSCGYESDLPACTNELDDDADGKIDCYDPDCYDNPLFDTFGYGEDDCPEGMETICTGDGDNDGDGLADCDDPDCAEDEACLPDESLPSVFDPPYENIICYENQGQNILGECVPLTKKAINIIGASDNIHLFSTGSPFQVLQPNDALGATSRLFTDWVYTFSGTETRMGDPFRGGVSVDSIDSMNFLLWYQENAPLSAKVIYEDDSFTNIDLSRLITNGAYWPIWHSVHIPASLLDAGKNLKNIEFPGVHAVSIDNFFFTPKANSGYSVPMYCSGTGKWVNDLDNDKWACNQQVPQGIEVGGFGGIGWAGDEDFCCGDDTLGGELLENSRFNDFPEGFTFPEGAGFHYGWHASSAGTPVLSVGGQRVIYINTASKHRGVYPEFGGQGDLVDGKTYVITAKVKIVSGSIVLGKGDHNDAVDCWDLFERPEGEDDKWITVSKVFTYGDNCGVRSRMPFVYSATDEGAEFYVSEMSLQELSDEEFFAGERGCFRGNIINNNKVVGDLFKTGNSFSDIMFYNGDFFACDPDETKDEFSGIEINYVDADDIGDDTEGADLIPSDKYKPLCARAGSYFCSHRGIWEAQSNEGEVYRHDDPEDANSYRCHLGNEETVNQANDWYQRYTGTCTESMCFCPAPCPATDPACGGEERGIYAECDALGEDLDEYHCVESGTVAGDHVCIDGSWTTKVGLMASYMNEYAERHADSFTIICNDASEIIYDYDLWQEDAAEKACVAYGKNGNDDWVILGTVLAHDKDPTYFAQKYQVVEEEFETPEEQRKIKVNVNLDEYDEEWTNDARFDLAQCAGALTDDDCFQKGSQNKGMRAFWVEPYSILFFSSTYAEPIYKDIRLSLTGDKISNTFDTITNIAGKLFGASNLITLVKNAYSWKQDETGPVRLPENLDGLYYTKQDNGDYIIAYEQSVWDGEDHEPNVLPPLKKRFAMASKGVSNINQLYISRLRGTRTEKTGDECGVDAGHDKCIFVEVEDGYNLISRLQDLRISEPPEQGGGGSSPIFAKGDGQGVNT
ncbi:MAG: hypothetical protein KKG59_06090 [Nanoarchaeota archaeon]|nr:hypothetical protein [Nanoarchaeota archaeon]